MIREIQRKDNAKIEKIIRNCLIEFDGDRKGLAWSDSDLTHLFDSYQDKGTRYWVIEENGIVVGGCGIGKLSKIKDICELQKMYCNKEIRGTKLTHELMQTAMNFAKQHYKSCYIETLSNMVAANKFYQKYGFKVLDKPLIQSKHYSCDVWYIKDFCNF